MKKGLLLSLIASTAIFAGGDIAPVEPAAAAPAANCSDFSGQAGIYYIRTATNTLFADATLAVDHQMGHGIGFGAEISGVRGIIGKTNSAKLTQLYLTYATGNTALKVGRFALPKALSPLAYTTTTAGMKDMTFEGGLIVNTDLADTTLYAAYVRNRVTNNTATATNLAAAGIQYTGLANTKLGLVGYYMTGYWGVAGTVDSNVGAAKVSLRATYNNAKQFGVGAKVSGTVGAFDLSLAATYASAKNGGSVLGAFNPFYTFESPKGTTVEANIATKVGPGKLAGKIAYTTGAFKAGNNLEARVGYSTPVWGNVTLGVEDRYHYTTTTKTGSNEVRVAATYKF